MIRPLTNDSAFAGRLAVASTSAKTDLLQVRCLAFTTKIGCAMVDLMSVRRAAGSGRSTPRLWRARAEDSAKAHCLILTSVPCLFLWLSIWAQSCRVRVWLTRALHSRATVLASEDRAQLSLLSVLNDSLHQLALPTTGQCTSLTRW
jgi:hypothetical protein